MKCKEVLKILKVTRPTLTSYVKSGQLKVTVLPNGDYDYDEDSVLQKAEIDSATCLRIIHMSIDSETKERLRKLNQYID